MLTPCSPHTRFSFVRILPPNTHCTLISHQLQTHCQFTQTDHLLAAVESWRHARSTCCATNQLANGCHLYSDSHLIATEHRGTAKAIRCCACQTDLSMAVHPSTTPTCCPWHAPYPALQTPCHQRGDQYASTICSKHPKVCTDCGLRETYLRESERAGFASVLGVFSCGCIE